MSQVARPEPVRIRSRTVGNIKIMTSQNGGVRAYRRAGIKAPWVRAAWFARPEDALQWLEGEPMTGLEEYHREAIIDVTGYALQVPQAG